MARGLMSFRFRSPIDFGVEDVTETVGNKRDGNRGDPGLICRNKLRRKKCKIEWVSKCVAQCFRLRVGPRRGTNQPAEERRAVVFPRQDENVGSLTLVEPRAG